MTFEISPSVLVREVEIVVLLLPVYRSWAHNPQVYEFGIVHKILKIC